MTGPGARPARGRALRAALAPHVERGDLPGLVALVAHGEDAHVEVVGRAAFGDLAPLRRDAIFRIASLTKPVGAAAAMTFVDDGTLRLDEPVDDLLPELADRRVLRTLASELDDTVPAARAITLRDLLSFRLGFGLVLAPPGSLPIQRAEQELGLKTLGPPWPPPPLTPDAWIARFARLPLMFQPGEQWLYNTGAQVLGVLLERAGGKPLEEVLRERIFGPLGMVDTAFSVAAEKLDRLVTAYATDAETGAPVVVDAPATSHWAAPPLLPNLGGWLLSTIDDYWAFARMLRGRGAFGGVRVLSEAAVRDMTTDQLTAEQRRGGRPVLGARSGWGLGLAVPAAGSDPREIAVYGGYGWNGGSGTSWRTDPVRDLTGILFTQRMLASAEPPPVFVDFWRAAYASVGA